MPRPIVLGLLVAAFAAAPALAQTAPPAPAPDTIRVNTADNRARALFNEGNAAMSAGDHAGALAKFEQGLRLDRNSVANQFGAALALEQMGREDDAIAALDRTAAMAEASGNAEYGQRARQRLSVYALRRALLSVQNEQTLSAAKATEALPLFQAVADPAGAGAAYHYQYARVLNALGRHADAVTHARMAAEQTDTTDKSAFYIELGLAERGAGNTAGARAAFEQARTGSWGAWAEHYLGELGDGETAGAGDAEGSAATDG